MFNDEAKLTCRGFRFYEFKDRNGYDCTLQKSSIATEDCVCVGLESASPIVLHSDATKLGIKHNKTCGYVDYPIPKEVSLNTRMHLTQSQAKELGKALIYFSETGELPRFSIFSIG